MEGGERGRGGWQMKERGGREGEEGDKVMKEDSECIRGQRTHRGA